MTYCVNPDCPAPENHDAADVCAACGASLLLNGRYQPIRVLGQGGFGTTFIARNVSLPGQPLFAVKQLRVASENPQAIERARQLFEREATALGKIGNHPQVPSLIDYFQDDCQFYLVQEYIKGLTLKQEVKRSGLFDEAKIYDFLLETLALLKYFQSREVIHRDIKPANIIRRSIDSRLVFIDFGAVKDEVTQTMLLGDEDNPNTVFAIGTPGFAPPEQLSLRPTFASDIYALGATCLYLMTGQSPKRFSRDPRTGAIDWRKRLQLSPGLSAVLDKMLQPNIGNRYSAAALVINDLKRVDLNVPTETAIPPELSRRSSEVEARSPRVASSTAASSQSVTPVAAPASSPSTPPQRQPTSRPTADSPKKWKSLAQLRAEQEHSEPGHSDSGGLVSPPTRTNLADARFHVSSSGSNTKSVSRLANGDRVTVRSLCRAYSQGHRDFTNCNLSGANLHGLDLSEINFNESKLIRTNLNSANLQKADLSQAGLAQASLRDANLVAAFLSYANLAGADLRGANLTEASLSYANLSGANLCGANLAGARVTAEQLSHAKTNWRTIMPNGKRGLFS